MQSREQWHRQGVRQLSPQLQCSAAGVRLEGRAPLSRMSRNICTDQGLMPLSSRWPVDLSPAPWSPLVLSKWPATAACCARSCCTHQASSSGCGSMAPTRDVLWPEASLSLQTSAHNIGNSHGCRLQLALLASTELCQHLIGRRPCLRGAPFHEVVASHDMLLCWRTAGISEQLSWTQSDMNAPGPSEVAASNTMQLGGQA